MTPSQIQTLEELDRWQAVIAKPKSWCKGAGARTRFGAEVNEANPKACKWCLVGAAELIGISRETRDLVRSLSGRTCLPWFNDDPSTTHADVMALFERAKEKVRNA